MKEVKNFETGSIYRVKKSTDRDYYVKIEELSESGRVLSTMQVDMIGAKLIAYNMLEIIDEMRNELSLTNKVRLKSVT